jgi:hypothetical protein
VFVGVHWWRILVVEREHGLKWQDQQGARTSMFGHHASMIYTPAPLRESMYKVFALTLLTLNASLFKEPFKGKTGHVL